MPDPAVTVHPVGNCQLYWVAFATAGVVNTNPDATSQIDEGPVGAAGARGAVVFITTANVCALLVPQEFEAVTVMFPLVAPAPVETVMVLVPAPEVMVHPDGTVHVYNVALGTAAMLYVRPDLFIHCSVAPLMIAGVAGVPGLTVTARVLAAFVPQELAEVTEIIPF